MKKEIGQRVKIIRENMNMTKEDFAKLIGMTGQYLGTVEKGIHGLTVEKIIKICKIGNYSADYLLFGTETNTNKNIENILSDLTIEQINNAFEILKSLALFIKNS